MENWVDDDVVRRWASLPASATPRPIVMLDSRVRIEGGFIDGDSKSAWLEGAIEPGVSVPSAVLALLPPRDPGRAQTVLTITDCVPTIALFRCDRGPRGLPAYRLSVTGLRGFCVVVSPDVECWLPASESEWRLPVGGTATVDEDGLMIHFPAFGGASTKPGSTVLLGLWGGS